MSTTIRDEEYVPMIVVDPKLKTLLICPVCGGAVSRSARSRHTAWHAHQLDTRDERAQGQPAPSTGQGSTLGRFQNRVLHAEDG